MDWKRLLAYISGSVDQELLLRNEYLVVENRVLRNQLKGRLRLSMNRRLSFFLIIGLLLLSGIAVAGNTSQEAVAISAAQNWLAVVDAGKYSISLNEAAQYFRNAESPLQWEQKMKAVRQPPGKLKSRMLAKKVYKTALPGAPDGEYVVIQ